MGILIGGIGSSHAPSIAHAWDQGHQQRPEWKPFFDAYGPVKQWLADQRVDTVVMFYNDHLNHFQFGNYPTFAMGIAETMPVCDEGDGPRDFPPVPGNVALGWPARWWPTNSTSPSARKSRWTMASCRCCRCSPRRPGRSR